MSNKSYSQISWLVLAVAIGVWLCTPLGQISAAEEKPAIKVADYARAEDLLSAQTYFLTQFEEPLASKAEYAEDLQERVKKNALVLAIVTMNLGLHEQATPAETKSPLIYPLAVELAANSKDYDKAKAIYDKLMAATKSAGTADAAPLAWVMVRGQGAIMKKTNELHSAIKRNLTPTRFEKQLNTLKHQTATMAAIGQATLLDTHEVKKEADLPAYERYALEFRTAAAELNKAVHAADQAAALKAFARMDQSCHTCHQKFHPPKD
jgi:cytochrome c556